MSHSDSTPRSRNTSQPPVSHVVPTGAPAQPVDSTQHHPSALNIQPNLQIDASGNSSPITGTPVPAGKASLPAGVSASLQQTQPGTPSTVSNPGLPLSRLRTYCQSGLWMRNYHFAC